MSTRFNVNRPHVISETIDGETVMIDLRSGSYFSLDATAAAIWRGIEAGAPMPAIAAAVAAAQGAPVDVVEADLARLAGELVAEDLIVAATDEPAATPDTFDAGSGPYRTPSLDKFTDMQDLLLLDPVHDVDDRGWPHQPDELDV